MIYSIYSLHNWNNPDKAAVNLYSAVKKGEILYIYVLRRVWRLYWVPIKNGFFKSIKASYLLNEIKLILRKLGIQNIKIQKEFSFLLSSFVKNKLVISKQGYREGFEKQAISKPLMPCVRQPAAAESCIMITL